MASSKTPPMKLRPHHVLDIVSAIGHGAEFRPHPYGHAVHTVAEAIQADVDLLVEFVVGADEICRPCRHLQADGTCDDVLHQLNPPISKQEYNDALDRRLFEFLHLPSTPMTLREYLQIVQRHLPGIEAICTHPGEDREQRLKGLQLGLAKLGIGSDQPR